MVRWIVIVVLVVGLLATLLISQRPRREYVVSGTIEVDDIRVGSRVGGRVAETLVREGDAVAAGQVLARLEPFDLNERLAAARAQLASRQAELAELRAGFRVEEVRQARARRDRLQSILDALVAGTRPLEIEIARSSLTAAEARLGDAQRELDRVRPLFEGGTATRDEFDRANLAFQEQQAARAAASDQLKLAIEGPRQEDIAAARAALAEAQAELDMLERGYRQEDIDRAKALVEAAEAELAATQRQLDELAIYAPQQGVVEAIDLLPGDLVAASAPVITLIDPGSLHVRAYLPENRLDVAVGARLPIRVDAYPGEEFEGEIIFIARQAEFTPSNAQTPEERVKQVFRVKVRLMDSGGRLRPGMAADLVINRLRPAAAAPASAGQTP